VLHDYQHRMLGAATHITKEVSAREDPLRAVQGMAKGTCRYVMEPLLPLAAAHQQTGVRAIGRLESEFGNPRGQPILAQW
jgi:hypothetical protein